MLWLLGIKHCHTTDLLLSPTPQHHLSPPASMEFEEKMSMKEYIQMMMDMIVLCATLALSLFFWITSLVISSYYGNT